MPDLSLDMILEIAARTKETLERDALRTIRKADGREEGLNKLAQVEGIERFVEDLKQACGSSFYRQLGYIKEPKKVPLFNRRTKKQMEEARRFGDSPGVTELRKKAAGGE
jgi:hypothetical protein